MDNFARDIVCSRACVLLDVGVRQYVAACARAHFVRAPGPPAPDTPQATPIPPFFDKHALRKRGGYPRRFRSGREV